jgi:hypothetical protein
MFQDGVVDALVKADVDIHKQVVLARKIVVDRRFGQVARLGDHVHACFLEAVPDEKFLALIEDKCPDDVFLGYFLGFHIDPLSSFNLSRSPY